MSLDFYKAHIRRLFNENKQLSFAMSYKDYIYKDLTSVVLSSNEQGIVRMFVLDNPEILRRAADHRNDILAAHNHGYDFETVVLSGQLQNIEYVEASAGHNMVKYEYVPSYAGSNSLKHVGEVTIKARDITTLRKGEFYALKHDQIHKVGFTGEPNFCALFFEGKPQRVRKYCYVNEKVERLPAVYSRFDTLVDLEDVINDVLERI